MPARKVKPSGTGIFPKLEHLLIDIISSREILRITSNIDRMRGLIHANIVHTHMCREWEIGKVDGAEVRRHSKVHDEVLFLPSVTSYSLQPQNIP